MRYRQRAIEEQMKSVLNYAGAVLLQGARASGKTSTALQYAHSDVRLDRDVEERLLAVTRPELVLSGPTPRLIDEWQLAPDLWNAARHEVDRRQEPGQFIFSGSAAPTADITRHTGAGRFARLKMRPMSLAESGVSTREVSLSKLRKDRPNTVSATSEISYEEMAEQAVRGGWPALLDLGTQEAIRYNTDYSDDLALTELADATGRRTDQGRISRLLRVLARNLGGELNVARISSEVAADGHESSRLTLRKDLDALEQVFAYDPLRPWSVDLRSRSRLRKAESIHFTDPALATAILGVDFGRLARQPQYFGFIFESMVVRDMRCYVEADGGKVFRYKDNTDLEVDIIADYRNTWAACEVKLGINEIVKAEANLLKLRDERVDLEKVGEPAFLGIVTATKYAYTLPSGVHVLPLATLTW